MGNCLAQGDSPETERERASQVDVVAVTVGKNQPLQPVLPVWASEAPITRGQLLSKRDEFWDTAPMFDGRKEIWDALKAAAYALENHDVKLAQAVVDGASISLPTGSLADCYDELGNKYQLPAYVLSAPTNLVVEADDCDDDGGGQDDLELAGEDTSLKLRLSSGKDVKIVVKTTETIAKAKQKLSSAEFDGCLESSQQRWFFGGRVLGDKLHIEDAKIPRGHVVQVVLAATAVATSQQQPPPSAATIQPVKSDLVEVVEGQPVDEAEVGGGDAGVPKSVLAVASSLPSEGQQPSEKAVTPVNPQQQQHEGTAAQASSGLVSAYPTPVGS